MVKPNSLIHQPLFEYAKSSPAQIAIDEGNRSLNYGELARAVNVIAGCLQQSGIQRYDRIAIFCQNGIEGIAGLLGSLRADACYVPLDPSAPVARAALILEDCEVSGIITQNDYFDDVIHLLAEHSVLRPKLILVLDLESKGLEDIVLPEALSARDIRAVKLNPLSGIMGPIPQPAPNKNIEEDLAYIIFTSGTTGRPKGVMIPHRNVNSLLRWAVAEFEVTSQDRIANHSRMAFDVSVFDIFAALKTGATICPITNRADLMFPLEFMRDRKITIWNSVPGPLSFLKERDELNPGCIPEHVRIAIFTGDQLPVECARLVVQGHPHLAVYNCYGPTEVTIWSTYWRIPHNTDFDKMKYVPIGHSIPGMEHYVLDENGNIAKQGEMGTLMILGNQLSPGYWNRSELTQEKFLLNPFKSAFGGRMYDVADLAIKEGDDFYTVVGRRDNQVKIRGYRVELGEIEAILAKHEAVAEAATVFSSSDSELIAAIVLNTKAKSISGEDWVEQLLCFCQDRIPAYMVPTQVKLFEALPRNPNGKVDRNAILRSFQHG